MHSEHPATPCVKEKRLPRPPAGLIDNGLPKGPKELPLNQESFGHEASADWIGI